MLTGSMVGRSDQELRTCYALTVRSAFRSRATSRCVSSTVHKSLSGRCSSVIIGSISGNPTAENLRVHPLKDRFGVLGGQVHVAADDI